MNKKIKDIFDDRLIRLKNKLTTKSHVRHSNKKVSCNLPIEKKSNINKIKEFRKVSSNSIFITGGIGDIFAVESFLTDQERHSLTTIYYATNKRVPIESLFRCLKNFPNLRNHINVWDDVNNFWCFYSLEDYLKRTNCSSKFTRDLKNSKDLSIIKIADEVKQKKLLYNGSSFLKENLTSIEKFNISEKYVVISPFSTDKRLDQRDFDKHDWDQTLIFLNQKNIKGVVINSGNDVVPEHSSLINLSNLTKIEEAVEILKMSEGYFGIDSCLSVLAAKLFDKPFLQIKTVNKHCTSHFDFYYAPKNKFNFINREISTII